MAQVAVTDTSIGDADASTIDVTHIVGSGDVLIVMVMLEVTDDAKEVSGINWDDGGGDEAALVVGLTALNPGSSKLRIECWVLTNPVAKTATVQVTLESAQKAGVTCISVSNVDTTTPLKNLQTQDNSSANSGDVSVSQNADDLCLVVAGHFTSAGGIAPASSENELEDFAVQGTFKMWAAEEDGDGSTLLSWTAGGGNKESATYGFAVATGAAPTIAPPIRHPMEAYKHNLIR